MAVRMRVVARPELLQRQIVLIRHWPLCISVRFISRHPSLNTMHPLVSGAASGNSDSNLQRSYESAISCLNRLQSNASVIEMAKRVRASDPCRNLTHTRHYLKLMGITDRDLKNLNAIHVAGTKGKGSTCAFTDSVLSKHHIRTGLYSSPHLIEARERIRINGQPLSRERFAFYFWETYDTIRCREKSDESTALGIPVLPTYFMFLTVMAVHVFVTEKVEAAIMEVGIGGEYDCTNFLKEPAVVGITSLALDHVELLGTTLASIAWQKSGIMKANVPAFTVQQDAVAMPVLHNRAIEKGCKSNKVHVVPHFTQYRLKSRDSDPVSNGGSKSGNTPTLVLGIAGIVQETNASLAVQLCHRWLQSHSLAYNDRVVQSHEVDEDGMLLTLPQEFAEGLSSCRWPGRYQIISTVRSKDQQFVPSQKSGQANAVTPIHFFLDGAHTKESINLCIDWFSTQSSTSSSSSAAASGAAVAAIGSASSSPVNRVLLFNCTGYRNPFELLAPILIQDLFDVVLFSPNKVMRDKSVCSDQSNFTIDPQNEEKKAEELKNVWMEMRDAEQDPVRDTNHQDRCPRSQPTVSPQQIVKSFTCLTEAMHWIHWYTGQDGPCEGKDTHVLVTGSLHLVGGVLGILNPGTQSYD